MIEEMLTMRPQPCSTIPSHTCFVMLYTESRLVRITASQFTLSSLLKLASRVMPALLIRMLTGPTSAAIRSTHRAHES
ncbi:hypothetical protein R75461_08495 [Paraburkholderia nemoris]|nr:hypothetical protein R75461_08495 [Paraburkholderia nemoris]